MADKKEPALKSLLLTALWLLASGGATARTLSHYRAVPLRCLGNVAVLRHFDLAGRPMRLVVDTRTLQTRIERRKKGEATHPCADSRYTRLLRRASAAPWPLQNDGITHGKQGRYLTTDLCPSSKPGYERRLYRALISRLPHPVPVTLFITKRWINKHPAAFNELRRWNREGKLAITWGNHTAWHHYHPGHALRHNFVLSPEENLSADILELEKTLIVRGVTPSVFFRFPGLISDRESVETVAKLGLIPIGTDAWLAKGQSPRQGSIILVHGNKNEPRGIDLFLHMLKEGAVSHLDPLQGIHPPSI